jgi:hypothetical protein
VIGSFKKNLPIIIHGAGFTGIHLAQKLWALNIPFQLYEKSSHIGGLISEETTPYGVIFKGPQSLLYKTNLNHLIPTKKFKKGFFFKNSFISLPKCLFFFKSFQQIPQYSSAFDSLKNIFSEEEISLFIDPILRSIFNEESKNLSGQILPKRIIHLLKSFFSLKSQESIDGFYHYLLKISQPFHHQILFNKTFSEDFTKFNHFFCVPSYQAANIIPDDSIKNILCSIPYSSVTQIHVFFENNPLVFQDYEGILNSSSEFYFTGVFKRKNYYIFFYGNDFCSDHFLQDIKNLGSKILYKHEQTYSKAFPVYNSDFFIFLFNPSSIG